MPKEKRQKLVFIATAMAIILVVLKSGYFKYGQLAQAQGGCPAVQNTPKITYAYGDVTVNGMPAPIGTVVEARSPRDDVVGCFVVTEVGVYGAMPIYGEDTSITPPIPGMRTGEPVTFHIDGNVAEAASILFWLSDKDLHWVDVGATITSLSGSVTLQGRPVPPNPSWQVPLTVGFYESGRTTPNYQFSPITDDTGHFAVLVPVTGTYNIAVKNAHTLRVAKTVTIAPGVNNVAFGTLREGDADNNNAVTLLDFNILAVAFGKCIGDVGYDERADFDQNGCVTLLDFNLLAVNFGQLGD